MADDKIPTYAEYVSQKEDHSARAFAEWFFKTYTPEDRNEAARFHADLYRLFAKVYEEAQAPLIKQMATAMSLVTPGLFLKPPAKGSGQ